MTNKIKILKAELDAHVLWDRLYVENLGSDQIDKDACIARKVKNRAAIALRLGAHCLYHAKNYLGAFYRKMKWRLGVPEAVTATAHKLARIVYHMLSTREPYSESVLANFRTAVTHS